MEVDKMNLNAKNVAETLLLSRQKKRTGREMPVSERQDARMKVEDKKRFERLMRRRQLLTPISNWFFMRERCNIGV